MKYAFQYNHIKIDEHKILPKNLHPLTITPVLNFHKALKNYARSPQHYFKLPVKLIKRVKLRVHYTLPGLYMLSMRPPSSSSSMLKQHQSYCQKTCQLASIKENYCESGAKCDTSAPSCLVLATLRMQTQDPKRDLKQSSACHLARVQIAQSCQKFAPTSPLSTICLLRGY